jgi:CheY-like chemotaxis protein
VRINSGSAGFDAHAGGGSKRVTQTSNKVLIVEDEAMILFMIADELRAAGFVVLEARDSDEAIRLLDEHDDVRLLFTDIDMPGSMDGLRLSAVVRDRWPPVRIILTSGKQNPPRAKLPRGSQFMAKPYTPSGVVRAVRTMLA